MITSRLKHTGGSDCVCSQISRQHFETITFVRWIACKIIGSRISAHTSSEYEFDDTNAWHRSAAVVAVLLSHAPCANTHSSSTASQNSRQRRMSLMFHGKYGFIPYGQRFVVRSAFVISVAGSTATTHASSTTSCSQPTSPTTAVHVLPHARSPLCAEQDAEKDHESTAYSLGIGLFVQLQLSTGDENIPDAVFHETSIYFFVFLLRN